MKEFLITITLFIYNILVIFPITLIISLLRLFNDSNKEGIVNSKINKFLIENKFYLYLEKHITVYDLVEEAKDKIIDIISKATYKTDVLDATTYIERLVKRKEFKILTKKEKERIKQKLYNYTFEEVVPRFRHRIAVL